MATPPVGRLRRRLIASALMRRVTLLFSLMIAVPAVAGPRAILDEAVNAWQNRTQTAPPTAIDVAFAPRGSPERLVVQFIARCPADLRVALYSFTNKAIAAALVARHRAGVDVRVVADQSQRNERRSVARLIADAGIATRISHRYAIMHDKFAVCLGNRSVETGSFNWTEAAEHRNAENAIVFWSNDTLASAYAHEWSVLWMESSEDNL